MDAPSKTPPGLALRLGLLASLAALLWHSWSYRFLTDDAFIAFRYARNLSDGYGLAFNPGHEWVEGFSSPLWVLILACMAKLGADLPQAATWISLGCTVLLWWGLLRMTRQALPEDSSPWWCLLPLGWLALTRSVAVWSTGGLETRFFEALVIWTILRLWSEAKGDPSKGRRRPLAGLMLALLAWTRPEGALLTICLPLALWVARSPRMLAGQRWLVQVSARGLIGILLLFLARMWIFGEWLPNTYYAKLDGRTWWSMGLAYGAQFALEYGLLFWLPLLWLGLRSMGRSSVLLALLIGTCLPFTLYVISIGGDHFEYRPLDLIFPYAFGLMALGLQRGLRGRGWVVGALVALVSVGLWSLPRATASSHPNSYRPGFPGLDDSQEARQFPQQASWSPYRLPLLAFMAGWHRELLQYTSSHFVGLRQEEHRSFFELVQGNGLELKRLIDSGSLPANMHIAIDCVGAIPYHSDLQVMDRLGLTDAEIARSPFARAQLSAHGKYATPNHAQKQQVDFWALHPTILVWDAEDPTFQGLLSSSREAGQELGIAEVEPGKFLLAWLPNGLAATRSRWPELGLKSSLGE